MVCRVRLLLLAVVAALASGEAFSLGPGGHLASGSIVRRVGGAQGRAGRKAGRPGASMAMPAAAVVQTLRGGAVGIGGPESLLPPIVTLAVALATKQVTVALLLGIWSGSMLLTDFSPLTALLRTVDTHVVGAVADVDHATVLLFNLILGGTIGLVQKGGGALGLAKSLRRFATDARSCLATASALAAMIFFDEYASILIVGNSFRPLLPMLQVCREKFAMLLHFVSVSVASMSPVSSWIGIQVGSVATATEPFRKATGASIPDPFLLCMQTVPYRIFPLAALGFVLALLVTNRDFGPMAQATEATRQTPAAVNQAPANDANTVEVEEAAGPLDPKPDTPLRALNAIIPFGTIAVGTLVGMVLDGRASLLSAGASSPISLVSALSNSDSIKALLWGSTFGWISAMGLLISQRILNLGEAMETFVNGMKDVVEPCLVLTLAWGLGSIITETNTADFIAQGLTSWGVPVWGLPAIVSMMSYAISFATGSSFGTMSILFPLVGPLAWQLGEGNLKVLRHCFGAVFGGAIFGNVFSPIADTTILTVLSTKVSLPKHVATSAPYALVVGLAAIVFGDLGIGLNLYGPLVALAVTVAAQTGVLRFFGRRPPKGT